MASLERLVQMISRFTYAIGAVAIAMMMIQVTIHVVSQRLFSYPLPGTYLFVSNYYMVVVTFLCLAAVELRDGHISVDILASQLPKKAQNVLAMLAQIITMIMFSMITWQSLVVAESRRSAGTFEIEYGIKILIWPSYYVVPLGASLFVLICAVKLAGLLLGRPIKPETQLTEHT